jgi:hypothetical protein
MSTERDGKKGRLSDVQYNKFYDLFLESYLHKLFLSKEQKRVSEREHLTVKTE